MIFDRDAVIEQVRDEISGWPIGNGYYGTQVHVGDAADIASAVVPVIVDSALEPLETLHSKLGKPCTCCPVICGYCGDEWPCTTVQMIKQIKAESRAER